MIPFSWIGFRLKLTQSLSLVEVARAVGSYYKEIKEMNPHLSEENIPAGVHFLNLPPGNLRAVLGILLRLEKGIGAEIGEALSLLPPGHGGAHPIEA